MNNYIQKYAVNACNDEESVIFIEFLQELRNNLSYSEFIKSTGQTLPPQHLSEHLRSLWYDKNSNWDQAHSIIQQLNDSGASRIHAYLHRKEGDLSNANYWYSRAGMTVPRITLDEEWEELARQFCENDG